MCVSVCVCVCLCVCVCVPLSAPQPLLFCKAITPMLLILSKVFIWIKMKFNMFFIIFFLVQTTSCQFVDEMQWLAIGDEDFLNCNDESMFVALCPSGTVWNDLTQALFGQVCKVLLSLHLHINHNNRFFPLSLLISQLQFHLFINYRSWSTIIRSTMPFT